MTIQNVNQPPTPASLFFFTSPMMIPPGIYRYVYGYLVV
jgi:hypothetical protein